MSSGRDRRPPTPSASTVTSTVPQSTRHQRPDLSESEQSTRAKPKSDSKTKQTPEQRAATQNLHDLGILSSRSKSKSGKPTHIEIQAPFGSHQHHQQSARPVYARGTSHVSTHSPGGHPYRPIFKPQPSRTKTKTGLGHRAQVLNRIAARQCPGSGTEGSDTAGSEVQYYSNGTSTSFNWRSGRPMAGMLEVERSRTRRERTFIGSECAVCEEPLEYTLRGERILQFSCGHVSHEACFYEYIKEFDAQFCPTCNAPLGLDTSRGGNVLDLEKLSSIVRSVAVNNSQPQTNGTAPNDHENRTAKPTQWESNATDRPGSRSSEMPREKERESIDAGAPSFQPGRERKDRDQQRERVERYGMPSRQSSQYSSQNGTQSQSGNQPHQANQKYNTQNPHLHQQDSIPAENCSQSEHIGNGNGSPGRRHDYDLHSMESAVSSPRTSITRNPIPAPTVTVRSEYPTLTRSRQQQALTCLVTIEVPEGKWRPDPADLRGAPSTLQSQGQDRHERQDGIPPMPNSPPQQYHQGQSQGQGEWQTESPETLEEMTEDLRVRVDNWHGLDFSRFGKLRLYGTIRVGKDRRSWQDLECFLFAEMLICVKEKKGAQQQYADGNPKRKLTRCTLKGSILIKKHLKSVDVSPHEPVLTLSLSVQDLQQFHLQFQSMQEVERWRRSLLDLNKPAELGRDTAAVNANASASEYEMPEYSGTDDEDYRTIKSKRLSSVNSSYGGPRSVNTNPTEYTSSGMVGRSRHDGFPRSSSMHVPLDIVVVIPVSSSMQGLKITLLRDSLKFLVQNLGDRDRMGLVTFGSSGGGVPLVGMTTKNWSGWNRVLNSIRPVGQKALRADVVEGANVAMDLLMQRKANNPLATILLISDSSTSDAESVDFVVSRAEAAKVAIHSFGLGLTHKPDTMIELSTRTKASYTYVKDWMMLRECVAGCLGSIQTTSHQNVKLKLRLPEGSPAKFVKISGALQITKRATGKDAEAALGNLRFGDKRDILVQLVIAPDTNTHESLPQDPWESIVSGLEALGGPLDSDEHRSLSVDEVPLIQADLSFGDILRDGTITQSPRPSLLAITMLPMTMTNTNTNKSGMNGTSSSGSARLSSPPIPPHPSIVQRRMELLTSDMLTRALTLVSRGQHDRAHHLLKETRTILRGLGKGGLPPLPPAANAANAANATSNAPNMNNTSGQTGPPQSINANGHSPSQATGPDRINSPASDSGGNMIGSSSAPSIDAITLNALDTELEASLEWINHPAVFGRDSRKAVLQAIGVIASQRGYTFRSPSESLWAGRIGGVKRLTKYAREWRDAGDVSLMEES